MGFYKTIAVFCCRICSLNHRWQVPLRSLIIKKSSFNIFYRIKWTMCYIKKMFACYGAIPRSGHLRPRKRFFIRAGSMCWYLCWCRITMCKRYRTAAHVKTWLLSIKYLFEAFNATRKVIFFAVKRHQHRYQHMLMAQMKIYSYLSQ